MIKTLKKTNGLLLILGVIFIGCTDNQRKNESSETSDENHRSTFSKIIEKNEINVGYFIFEPTIMMNPDTGKLEGVFIDMFEEITKSINPTIRINYMPTTLATFHTELNSNKFDICIGATFATPKRSAVVAFSHPLFYCGYTGIAKKENAEYYDSWKKVDNPNVKVAVLQGSAISDLVRVEFENQKNIVSYSGSDLTIPLAAVGSDQADIGLMNQITVFTYLREHPELEEVLGNDPLATTYFSWSVRQDDLIWLNFIDTSIDYMINSGKMYRFEKEYGVPLMHDKKEYFFPLTDN
ncbi:substrate-binding periplasmic protein [Flagellimonas sp.]|uniref:substrate-binding periplasmic protein n=1 Tax=Flagellimonas sp. TaxID=2058762 RepID=UPI003F49BA2A